MKTKINWREALLPVCFFAFFFAFFLWGLLAPDQLSSQTENRTLSQRPALRRVLTDFDGFAQDFESYAKDQFPARETFVKDFTVLERLQGKKFFRSAYALSDGWLLTRSSRTSQQQREQLRAALQTAAGQGVPMVYCVLPVKNTVLYDLDPAYFSADIDEENKAALLSALQTVDGLTTLDIAAPLCGGTLAERERYFFKTDFHWNARGAYRAAEAVADGLAEAGLLEASAIPDETAFIWTDLTGRDYQGDLNRWFSNLYSMQEELPRFTPADCSGWSYYPRADSDETVPRERIVSSGLGNAVLSYNDLFTYNLGYYRVENPTAPDSRSILILKDSYQNATIDYLCTIFREVNVVDPRNYQEDADFPALLSARGVELVLLFYHQNNISTELIDFLS